MEHDKRRLDDLELEELLSLWNVVISATEGIGFKKQANKRAADIYLATFKTDVTPDEMKILIINAIEDLDALVSEHRVKPPDPEGPEL